MADLPLAPDTIRTGPCAVELAITAGVTELVCRNVAWLFSTFHCEPSDLMNITPESVSTSDCGVTTLAVPDLGMGGNCTDPVTFPRSRSTMLTDSPPEFATHNVRPSPSSTRSCKPSVLAGMIGIG